jgi:hypothetical protein
MTLQDVPQPSVRQKSRLDAFIISPQQEEHVAFLIN